MKDSPLVLLTIIPPFFCDNFPTIMSSCRLCYHLLALEQVEASPRQLHNCHNLIDIWKLLSASQYSPLRVHVRQMRFLPVGRGVVVLLDRSMY